MCLSCLSQAKPLRPWSAAAQLCAANPHREASPRVFKMIPLANI